jgi:WD40 repeat protein/energy-coupling factor transporter ATP-binding protein EcfA2
MTENVNRHIKTGTISITNPFPGLRPFTVEESHLFFGREGQSEIVLEYLAKNHFAAVTGASGSGKSSLIYCGLIPTLYGGFITNTGSYWKIITVRPGNSPIENLAEGLVKNEQGSQEDGDFAIRKQILLSVLRRSSFGLVDAIRQMKIAGNENVLLIVDQFEELFRFKESRKDSTAFNETEAYIKLLVNAIRQKGYPIYVVLTMRSDFIGECSQFQELTKLINKSNFLIPQMTRDDFREAILGPLAVGGAEIDPQLLHHILNSIEDKSDQLPVLQHAMMRTWEFWIHNNEPGIPLKMRDYEAAGRVENALSMHANEAFEELTEDGKRTCKSIFKCLTEKGSDNKGTRHPATVHYLAEIAQVPDTGVIEVVERFRAKGRSFLTPVEGTPIDSETVIDISHESLMRIWDKLKTWVDEEFSSVQMYLRLTEASSQFQLGKTGLWRPPDLHLALNWKKTQNPTLAWAKKYNPAFEKVMVFLDSSEKKYQQEEQNKVKIQRLELNRTRKFALYMLSAAVVLAFLVVFALTQRQKAIEKSNEAQIQRDEAEFRKWEADSLRTVAEGRLTRAEYDKLLAQIIADSAQRKTAQAIIQSHFDQKEKEHAISQADAAARQSEIALQEKALAERTTETALQQKALSDREKMLTAQKRMLNISQTMAVKALQADDKNLIGLLALQSYLFNRDYEGQVNQPDVYMALYAAMKAFNGDNYNGLRGHEGAVRSIAFVGNTNTFYSSGSDGKILRWDLSGSKLYRTLIDNNFINRSLSISNNGRWLACGTTTTGIQLFNLNQATNVPTYLEGHKGWVEALEFTSDSKGLFSSSTDNTIMYWDLIAGTNTLFINTDEKTRCLAVSPQGHYIVVGTDEGKVIRWNIDNKEKTILFQSDGNKIYAIKYNSSGSKIAFGDKNGNLRLMDTRSNTVIKMIPAHNAPIMDLSFSPDERQIATASTDKTLKLWDANNLNYKPVVITEHGNNFVLSVTFSPDGKYFVSSADQKDQSKVNYIYIWPAYAETMAEVLCSKLERNFSQSEWQAYVGADIEYHKTCPNK